MLSHLFALLTQARTQGTLRSFGIDCDLAGDTHVSFDWATQQPFTLRVEFVFDECHLRLGFDPETDAEIQPVGAPRKIADWRHILGVMDGCLVAVERFLAESRETLWNS